MFNYLCCIICLKGVLSFGIHIYCEPSAVHVLCFQFSLSLCARACVCVCVCVCERACVRACVRARACKRVYANV